MLILTRPPNSGAVILTRNPIGGAPAAPWEHVEQFVTAPNGALLDSMDNVCHGSAA